MDASIKNLYVAAFVVSVTGIFSLFVGVLTNLQWIFYFGGLLLFLGWAIAAGNFIRGQIKSFKQGEWTKRRIGKYLVVAIFLGSAALPLVRFLVVKSDAYALANSFVFQNEIVKSNLGSVVDCSLPWFYGASIKLNSSDGKAFFVLRTKGSIKSGEVWMNLRKQSGSWSITKALLIVDGEAHSVSIL